VKGEKSGGREKMGLMGGMGEMGRERAKGLATRLPQG